MTRQIKLSLSIVIVLVSGAGAYRWFRSVKTPAVSVAASATPAAKPAAPVISPVERVRSGTLPEFREITVGKAFERTFQSPEWKAEVNFQREKVVTFHGTATYAALMEAGFYIGTWNGVSQGIDAARQVSEHRQRCAVESGEARIASCMEKAYQAIVIPVAFEFTPVADNGVEMTMADSLFQTFDRDHRLKKDRKATLAFIYR